MNKIFPITKKRNETEPGRVDRTVTITLGSGEIVTLRKTFHNARIESIVRSRLNAR